MDGILILASASKLALSDMAFRLYDKYQFDDLSERAAARLLYGGPLTHLFYGADGPRLVTAVARPPSWRERIKADLPYFLHPDTLYWDSRLQHWARTGSESDPRQGVGSLDEQPLRFFVAHREQVSQGKGERVRSRFQCRPSPPDVSHPPAAEFEEGDKNDS